MGRHPSAAKAAAPALPARKARREVRPWFDAGLKVFPFGRRIVIGVLSFAAINWWADSRVASLGATDSGKAIARNCRSYLWAESHEQKLNFLLGGTR
jgi:hypothetical protein